MRGCFWITIGVLGCTTIRSSVVSPPGPPQASACGSHETRDCDAWHRKLFCKRNCSPFARPNEEVVDCRAVSLGSSLRSRYAGEDRTVLCEFR